MNDHFATAMGRALALTRASAAQDATRLIQETLNGKGSEAPALTPKSRVKRRRFGQVIDDLAKTRNGRTWTKGPKPTPSVPLGARYEAHTHASSFGDRDYRLFVPSPRDAAYRGLVLMLHGCTQDADDFAVGTQMNLVAEQHNMVVIYADQSRQANQMGCWNWFRPEDQGRGGGEPELLADLATTVATEFGIGTGQVFAAGLSAGGAMAAILGQSHPEIFAAVCVHSGLAPGSASDVAGAFAAMKGQAAPRRHNGRDAARSIVFHGTADTTVVPANADAVLMAALGRAARSEIEDRSVTGATVTFFKDETGATRAEKWMLDGVGHAWSGGAPEGSYTDPTGVDATSEMVRFFLQGTTD